MLVQDWLRQNNGDFTTLNQQFGINTTFHPTDERVILNYCQIDSSKHKTHPIVRECRGLVLNKNDFSLIARGFSRFFNLGEVPEDDKKFDWNNCFVDEKVDGSLILLYYWKNNWHVNTRASFGQGNINNLGITWRELFDKTVDWPQLYKYPDFTYVFELCSKYNKVVRDYPTPISYLLSIFSCGQEFSRLAVDEIARTQRLNRPEQFLCKSPDEVKLLIEDISNCDPTFEGVVIRDRNNNRLKCKADKYLQLHRLKNNGNLPLIKNLVPLVLAGETSEILLHFPEFKDKVEDVEHELALIWEQLDNNWYTFCEEESQKKFAIGIKNCPANSILFTARKSEVDWKKIFRESSDLLVKIIEGKLNVR